MIRIVVLFFWGMLASSPVLAEKLPCFDISVNKDSELAYTQRGNRCEGFYKSPIGAESISLVGLLYGKLEFDKNDDGKVELTVPPTIKQKVHIQGGGIPLKTYYRLDAWVQPGENFTWPLDIIGKGHLSSTHIGLLGRISASPEFYVPLFVNDNDCSSAALNLTLRSSVDVGPITWRLSSMDDKGNCEPPGGNHWETINPNWAGCFLSGQGIHLGLPKQQDNFCIELAAQASGSAEWIKNSYKIFLQEK